MFGSLTSNCSYRVMKKKYLAQFKLTPKNIPIHKWSKRATIIISMMFGSAKKEGKVEGHKL